MGIFSIFRTVPLIGIFFTITIVIFIYVFVRILVQWGKNNASPILSVPAVAVAKRITHHRSSHTSSTGYYVTFQFESGDRMELSVSGKEYGMIAEQDFGKLTFQGTRYHSFERM